MKIREYNCDACYVGTPHHPCQDYALAARGNAGGRPFVCAVLADGCSSSPHSDIGARIWCMALLRAFRQEFGQRDLSVERLEDRVSRKVRVARQALGLPDRCLDTTLIGLACDTQNVYAVAWGDGVICLPTPLGGTTTIDYPSGAPFYLSYLQCGRLRHDYEAAFDGQVTINRSDGDQEELPATTAPTVSVVAPVADLPEDFVLSAFSDGISSFRDADMNIVAGLEKEFCAFRNRNGKYVERRFRKAMKQCRKQELQPFDDVSCISICGI